MAHISPKYKHAVIATDVAIFTVQGNELKVLLIKMKKEPFTGMWALPGGIIKVDESVDDAAARILEEKTGVTKIYLEQLATFGKVDRDPFGRVVSVAYFALVPSATRDLKTTQEYEGVDWFPVHAVPVLAYDHAEMLSVALAQLKKRLEYSNIAFSLLPAEFTLTELQQLYETILGQNIDKRNFRKSIEGSNLVTATGKQRQGAAHRPAQLYRFISRTSQTVKVL